MNEQPPITNRVPPAPPVESKGRQAPAGEDGSERQQRRALRRAVALEYRRGKQRAPVVTASGRGHIAEQIIALAEKHGIYVQHDPDLVELLAQLDLGAAIPPQLYYVVAEILAFVYKLNSAQAARSPESGEVRAPTLNLKRRTNS
ncbi:MAG TPA: EscU/YscU/HrcU family type III secretion system export apparatus switch protein [Chloroflexota bacterium]|nr:EscU/YscU/HrcU family type III secretion system export apparatus switch protein [Chloroflexota bacterium]